MNLMTKWEIQHSWRDGTSKHLTDSAHEFLELEFIELKKLGMATFSHEINVFNKREMLSDMI